MIKVGDNVLIRKTIRYGYNIGRGFMVTAKVERETKTQWIVDGRRFKKETLREIGKFYSTIETDLSKCEQDEMEKFRRTCVMVNSVGYIDNIGRLNVDMPIEKIERAYKAHCELVEAIKDAIGK